jgi:hypothetical protein
VQAPESLPTSEAKQRQLRQDRREQDAGKEVENWLERYVTELEKRRGDRFNYGQAFAIYGQTRAGKSSIRHHCKTRIPEIYRNFVALFLNNEVQILELCNREERIRN